MKKINHQCVVLAAILAVAPSCSHKNQYGMGSYGFERNFLEQHKVGFLELKSTDGMSRLLVVPAYQGRVMTSTGGGMDGNSYGWINHDFIASGKKDPQINVYGGEERFWLGPEGGPFSIYFKQGDEQVYANWKVPPVIDTEEFDVLHVDDKSVGFSKDAVLENAHGTVFRIGIRRDVRLLGRDEASKLLGTALPEGLSTVAYETVNTITNLGKKAWTREGGLLSIWMLSMFNPSPQTTVFIPFRPGGKGPVVHDDYFGKVPPDRLVTGDSAVFFRIDGKFRSKIGIPPDRTTGWSGSYDRGSGVLTLLWCSLPDKPMDYVNSSWGDQEDPFSGDAVNSYNDGPLEDGSVMGPFYEIEASSPAAALDPGGSIQHSQRLFHIQGSEAGLSAIVKGLFGLDLEEIADMFR